MAYWEDPDDPAVADLLADVLNLSGDYPHEVHLPSQNGPGRSGRAGQGHVIEIEERDGIRHATIRHEDGRVVDVLAFGRKRAWVRERPGRDDARLRSDSEA